VLILETEPHPVQDGISSMRRAPSLCPDLRCIVLSSRSDPVSIEAALTAGASAYVMKSAHPDDLASAVRQAFQLSVYFSPPEAEAPTARANTV
jgi:DNA-binding NarL/FixJ family response regulator